MLSPSQQRSAPARYWLPAVPALAPHNDPLGAPRGGGLPEIQRRGVQSHLVSGPARSTCLIGCPTQGSCTRVQPCARS